jgi:4-hydroxy-tetrahydrodipicolinate synthase
MAKRSTLDLAGVFPALTTPFAADGSIELDRLRANLARYNSTGLAGHLVTGSTGEAVLLDREEIERVWAAAREAAGPEKILIAGVGAESTRETIARAHHAASLGYDAALAVTPSYYKPAMTAEALAEHFLRVADAARIPVLLYSVPQFTGVALEAPVVERLAGHPNIAGMKDSSGNIHRLTEILAAVPPGFQLLVGSAGTLYASLALGAVGGVLALACALPEACLRLYDAARQGDTARARALQQHLLAANAALVSRYGIAGLKYAMDRLGYYGGPPRPPLRPVPEAAAREIDVALATLVQLTASPG